MALWFDAGVVSGLFPRYDGRRGGSNRSSERTRGGWSNRFSEGMGGEGAVYASVSGRATYQCTYSCCTMVVLCSLTLDVSLSLFFGAMPMLINTVDRSSFR